MKTQYEYNSDKFISVLENTLKDISKVYGYTYDDNGNITTETVTTKDAGGNIVSREIVTYTYDDKEQLISAETATSKYEYSYNDRGNILTKKEYAVTVDETGKKVYTLIEANTDTYVYDETWKDKLISYNGQTITYDAVGNPINYMGNTLTWTMGRQLASFGNISYAYNEDGIRTSKTSNGVTTTYYLDGTRLLEQTDGTNTLHFNYDRDGEVVGFTHYYLSTGYDDPIMVEYIYVKNAQGDIVGITDPSGKMKVSYTYDPWGKLTNVESDFDQYEVDISILNPLRYRGYIYDTETGLYYLQSRYYDPETGRFINCDDVNYIGVTGMVNSYNAFAYCENEPVGHIDLFGYWAYDVHAGYYKTASLNKAPNPGKVTNKKYLYKGRTYIYLPRSKDSKSYYGTYYWAIQCGINANYARIIADYCDYVDTRYSPTNIFSTYYQGWHFNINRGTNKKDSRKSMSENEINNAKKFFDQALKKRIITKVIKMI